MVEERCAEMPLSPYEENLNALIEQRREIVANLPSGSSKAKQLEREIADLERRLMHYRKAVNRFRNRAVSEPTHH